MCGLVNRKATAHTQGSQQLCIEREQREQNNQLRHRLQRRKRRRQQQVGAQGGVTVCSELATILTNVDDPDGGWMGSEATNNHGQELLSIMQTVTVNGEWLPWPS
jgi:hypothetical protein